MNIQNVLTGLKACEKIRSNVSIEECRKDYAELIKKYNFSDKDLKKLEKIYSRSIALDKLINYVIKEANNGIN